MPLVFRSMAKDVDGYPVVEASAKGLGVREGQDFEVGEDGMVHVGSKGMSVAPAWRDLPIFRIPKRLKSGGQGKDSLHCFKTGTGPFKQSMLTEELELLPDEGSREKPVRHGVIRPARSMTAGDYVNAIEATRMLWIVDES